jgi:hypothetical protein
MDALNNSELEILISSLSKSVHKLTIETDAEDLEQLLMLLLNCSLQNVKVYS